MAIPTEKAYEILGLPLGASKDAIEQSYKKLAVKWHPEKYTTAKKTQDALKKFKMVNLAYRKLIHNNERNEKDITLHEMFEQYRQVFHSENNKKNGKLWSLSTDSNNESSSKTTASVVVSSKVVGSGVSNGGKNNNTLLELNANNNYANTLAKSSAASSKSGANLVRSTTTNGSGGGNSEEDDDGDDEDDNDRENSENIEHQTMPIMTTRRGDSNGGGEDLATAAAAAAASIRMRIKALAIKGNELAKQSEFDKAIDKYTEAIRYDSTDHRLFSNRSYCYDKINNFFKALEDAERAILLEPQWPKGYFRKGRALFGLKMYKEAEEAYEKVLEIDNINDPELEEELFKTRALQLQEMGFSKAQSENAIKNSGTVQAALEAILKYSETDRSNESCSDMDNNELDYNENDSETGDDNLSTLLNKKLQSSSSKSTSSKQQQQKSAVKANGTQSPTTSESSSMETTAPPKAATPHTSYVATLLSNPAPITATTSSSNHHHHHHHHNHHHSSNSHTTTMTTTATATTNNSNSNSTNNSSSGQVATTSLWVGNVDSSVTEQVLIDMFSAYGTLTNVRCLPDKYCAFVNFKTKEEASKAMSALQGKPLEGQRLLIKYPDNPNTYVISNIIKTGNKLTIDKKAVKRVAAAASSNASKQHQYQQQYQQRQQQQQQQQTDEDGKPSGPVNGNECYFWRTTGCLYADKCRYEHVKKNKGVDKKPWHKHI